MHYVAIHHGGNVNMQYAISVMTGAAGLIDDMYCLTHWAAE